MKINKFTSLFATCLLMGLTACSNDNVSDADYSNSAKDKDLTGKTSFSITSEAKTRTSGVYDSGVKFYWTTKDNIWVNIGTTTSPTLTASSSTILHQQQLLQSSISTELIRQRAILLDTQGTKALQVTLLQ